MTSCLWSKVWTTKPDRDQRAAVWSEPRPGAFSPEHLVCNKRKSLEVWTELCRCESALRVHSHLHCLVCFNWFPRKVSFIWRRVKWLCGSPKVKWNQRAVWWRPKTKQKKSNKEMWKDDRRRTKRNQRLINCVENNYCKRFQKESKKYSHIRFNKCPFDNPGPRQRRH